MALKYVPNIDENPNPVYQRNGLWYHCDEIWVDEYGPFPSEMIARAKMAVYCHWLNWRDSHTGDEPLDWNDFRWPEDDKK